MGTLSTESVGLHFRPAEVKQFFNAEVGPGTPLEFEREASNPYDSNAIKVMVPAAVQIHHIGYIPKTSNAVLASLMDSGDALNVRGKVFAISGKIVQIEVEWDEA